MQIHIKPGRPDQSSDRIAELIWSTDPVLMNFMFGEISVFQRATAQEWPSKAGILCHKQAFVAEAGDKIVGLCIGHTTEEYGPNFEAAQRIQSEALGVAEGAHIQQALTWMDRLFPDPQDGSFYVLELAVSDDAQGQGLGRKLLSNAVERARQTGCKRLALDVSADNPGVEFYLGLGLTTEIETRVPFLADNHGVGTHLHMSAPIDALDIAA